MTQAEPSNLSYLILRRSVGGIGIGLPVALIVSGLLFGNIETTMSGFYYTGTRDIFVASNCIVGVFLLAYGGYGKADDEWFSDRALGVFTGYGALVLALVPTSPEINATSVETYFGYLHLAAAACFLLGLGIFSFAKFSRTTGPHRQTYRLLGLVIFAALAAIAIGKFILPKGAIDSIWPDWVFWLEVVAVWAFGISWLIKGKTMQGVKNLRVKIIGA